MAIRHIDRTPLSTSTYVVYCHNCKNTLAFVGTFEHAESISALCDVCLTPV